MMKTKREIKPVRTHVVGETARQLREGWNSSYWAAIAITDVEIRTQLFWHLRFHTKA